MNGTGDLARFHAHVYFDACTRNVAANLREVVAARFGLDVGALQERPVGPHTRPMFEIGFTFAEFGALVSWLMLHRCGLSILVHPVTGDTLADHTTNPLWLGSALPIDLELLEHSRVA